MAAEEQLEQLDPWHPASLDQGQFELDLAFLDRVPVAYNPTVYAGPDQRTGKKAPIGHIAPLVTHRAGEEFL